jgi:hypothetical protein
MKRTRRSSRKGTATRIGLLLMTAILTVILVAGHADAQTPVRGGTLRIGWITAAKTLDPHYSVEFSERYVCYLVFNTAHILQNIVPRMRFRGFNEEDIQAMLVETARRILAFAAPLGKLGIEAAARRPDTAIGLRPTFGLPGWRARRAPV